MVRMEGGGGEHDPRGYRYPLERSDDMSLGNMTHLPRLHVTHLVTQRPLIALYSRHVVYTL